MSSGLSLVVRKLVGCLLRLVGGVVGFGGWWRRGWLWWWLVGVVVACGGGGVGGVEWLVGGWLVVALEWWRV